MLIELTVENWRGFDQEVCLDLRALEDSDSVHLHRTMQIDNVPAGDGHIHILPITGIYGANGAGKSSLLDAVEFLSNTVFYRETIPDTYDSSKDTIISAMIQHRGYIMQYGLSVRGNKVTDEWLLEGLPDGNWETVYDFDTISEQNKEMAPYLSNYDLRVESKVADAMWDWLRNGLVTEDFDALGTLPNAALQQLERRGANLNDVTKWLAMADSTICEISRIDDAIFPTTEPYGYLVSHKDRKHKWSVNINDESTGVRRMLGLYETYAGALAKGQTLFVDNFCEGIHPNLSRALCLYFTREDTNPNGAQLIFTSHDVQLFDHYTLLDDEIYFVDTLSDLDGNNGLYSLGEFHKIGGSNISNYLTGRYDAIPVFPDGNLFVPQMGNNHMETSTDTIRSEGDGQNI